VTEHASQITTIIALTRRSVKNILCLMGKRTTRNLSAVITKRFPMEKFIENLKMLAKFPPTSHANLLDEFVQHRDTCLNFNVLQKRSWNAGKTVFGNAVLAASLCLE